MVWIPPTDFSMHIVMVATGVDFYDDWHTVVNTFNKLMGTLCVVICVTTETFQP